MDRTRNEPEPASHGAEAHGPAQAAGKATLTSALGRRGPTADDVARAMLAHLEGAPVQRSAAGPGDPGIDVAATAADGFTGPASAPPHLAAIQRAFGRHDVSGVGAHVGGPAAEASRSLGAVAYASGDQVAFAEAPDLFLVAHELAHVVQQRGGVQLSRGVGDAGDEHERHADRVAHAVVSGGSAEGLLDEYAGGSAGAGAVVQRRIDNQAPYFQVYEQASPGCGQTVAEIMHFEDVRNPDRPYDTSRAEAEAQTHAQAVPEGEPEGSRGQHAGRRYAAVPLDDPEYNTRTAERGTPNVDPIDPDREGEILRGDQSGGPSSTLREVQGRHRDREVGQLTHGASTVQTIAARNLAEEAAGDVPAAGDLAEAVRRLLFVGNQYATVDTLNPAQSRRYQPTPGFTACNLYTFDHLRMMGVPEEAIPTGRRQRQQEDAGNWIDSATGGDANLTADEFANAPYNQHWVSLGEDPDRAQREANLGHIVICAAQGNGGHAGHYTVVMAENRGRGAMAHREGDDAAAPVDSPLESQAGGGRVANAQGEAVNEEGEVVRGRRAGYRRGGVEQGGYSTGNYNHESRQGRIDRGASDDGRHPHWWNHGHHGGFYLYRGGGVREGTDQGRSTFRGESEEATGMDYQTDGSGTAPDQPR